MTAITDQWMQFYQQPLMDGTAQVLVPPTEGFSAPTMPSETPKASASKPIRKRSRASKRTPTTLLNANTTNFRALVQQFTGCPSTTGSSLGVHKGPITLNFKQGSRQQIHHNTSRIVRPSSSRSYNQVHQVAVPLPWQKQQEQLPQQQSGYSLFDYVKSSDFVPTSGNSRPSTSMELSDGLLVDNDFSLHDLTVNAFSNYSF